MPNSIEAVLILRQSRFRTTGQVRRLGSPTDATEALLCRDVLDPLSMAPVSLIPACGNVQQASLSLDDGCDAEKQRAA